MDPLVEDRTRAGLQGLALVKSTLARALTRSRPSPPAVIPPDVPAETEDAPSPRSGSGAARWTFIGMVVLPAFLVAIYYAFIASDIYVSDAQFAVRTSEFDLLSGSSNAASETSKKIDGLKNVLSGSGPGMASQDAYIVTNYIGSKAIIADLQGRVDLSAIFRRSGTDWFARLSDGATREDLHAYWQKMVRTYIDSPSGLVSLEVRAFTPTDAQALAREIVALSEALVNRITVRQRTDVLEQAQSELRRAELDVARAMAELRTFRDKNGVLDPVKSADETGKLLFQLLTDRAKLESDIYVGSRTMSAEAPTLKASRARLESLDKQIATLRAKVAGSTSPDNMAGLLLRYEELSLRQEQAIKLLELASSGYERARVQADRQSLYLTIFAEPSLPEEAILPRRASYPLIAAVALLVAWGIIALLIASVQDHRL